MTKEQIITKLLLIELYIQDGWENGSDRQIRLEQIQQKLWDLLNDLGVNEMLSQVDLDG